MIVHDLSPEAVRRMVQVDLATADEEPPSPIGTFDFNGCTAGIAAFTGRGPWERHNAADELLLVLRGDVRLTVLMHDGKVERDLTAGDLVVVPRACWHGSEAPSGVTFLFLTPASGNEYSMSAPDPLDART
jgi:mannose-6-phosphate isomerase-like protein (cupin superfamily)